MQCSKGRQDWNTVFKRKVGLECSVQKEGRIGMQCSKGRQDWNGVFKRKVGLEWSVQKEGRIGRQDWNAMFKRKVGLECSVKGKDSKQKVTPNSRIHCKKLKQERRKVEIGLQYKCQVPIMGVGCLTVCSDCSLFRNILVLVLPSPGVLWSQQ